MIRFKRTLPLLLIVGLALSGCDAGEPVYISPVSTINASISASNSTVILPSGNYTIIIINTANTSGNITW